MDGVSDWRWDETAKQFVASGPGGRQLTIAWDAADRTYYLAVNVPPPPNMAGLPRAYVGPLSLLAVTLVLPEAFHEHVRAQVQWAYHEVADAVILEALHEVLDKAPQGWPEAVKAREAMERLAQAGPELERLANDVASADAWTDRTPT